MSNAGGMSTITRYTDMLAGNTTWNPWSPAGAYESIATTTVGAGGVSTVTFSSIPSTYKHLQLRFMARVSGATSLDNLTMRFNATAGTAYTTHYLQGNGASAGSSYVTINGSELYVGRLTGANSTSGMFGVGVIDILDYQDTNKLKTTRSLSGQDQNGSGELFYWSGLFNSTSAISEIKLLNDYAQHSSFALYGIRGN